MAISFEVLKILIIGLEATQISFMQLNIHQHLHFLYFFPVHNDESPDIQGNIFYND